jgi:hypothetical protein
LIAALLVGAGGTVGLLQLTGGSGDRATGPLPGPTSSPSPVVSLSVEPTALPSPSEEPTVLPSLPDEGSPSAADALIARLPAEVGSCQGAEPGGYYVDAVAVVTCSPTGHPNVYAYFYLFASEQAATSVYRQQRDDAGFVPDTGGCSTGEGGEVGWSGGGGSGRIMCGPGSGDQHATLLWTSDGFPIIGYLAALTPSVPLAQVYETWQDIPNYPA